MASAAVTHRELAESVVQSVLEDAFPDRDELALAPLAAALPEIRSALQSSGARITNKIIETSRTHSEEIDSWIHHSQKLRQDVEATKKRGREILELHKQTAELRDATNNATAHAKFLESEVAFSMALTDTLRAIKTVSSAYDRVVAELDRGDVHVAVNSLAEAEESFKGLEAWEDTFVVHLLKKRREEVRTTVIGTVEKSWNHLIVANFEVNFISVSLSAERNITSSKVAEALKRLGRFDEKIDALHLQIDRSILHPFLPSSTSPLRELHVTESDGLKTLQVDTKTREPTSSNLFSSLKTLLSFLQDSLPESVWKPLSFIFTPALVEKLVHRWLPIFIPTELSSINAFESLLQEVQTFQTYLETSGWSNKNELSDWVAKAGRVWLTKKRTHTLNETRLRISRGISEQTVKQKAVDVHEEEQGAPERFDEAWTGNWESDDEKEKPVLNAPATGLSKLESKDEEDVSGWGLDEEIEDPDAAEETMDEPEADDIEWDAWGGDEIDGEHDEVEPKETKETTKPPILNSDMKANKPVERPDKQEVMESYVATAVPQEVASIVKKIVQEAEELKTNAAYSNTPVAKSSAGLLSIPAQILATFRALAPIYYVGGPSMQMILYNDVSLLMDLLKDAPEQVMATSSKGLESLCFRTFDSAVSAQKIVLLDFIDSTQGFSGCTQSPQRDICFDAISTMVSLASNVEKDWKAVLPQSTFRKAFILGLLESVAEKIINDVEDIEDIAEEESHVLSSLLQTVAFSFDHIKDKGTHTRKLGALARILEASMAEIMAMMRKGEVDDFSEDELKDLIRALFAESELRRHVMGEIEMWARER